MEAWETVHRTEYRKEQSLDADAYAERGVLFCCMGWMQGLLQMVSTEEDARKRLQLRLDACHHDLEAAKQVVTWTLNPKPQTPKPESSV